MSGQRMRKMLLKGGILGMCTGICASAESSIEILPELKKTVDSYLEKTVEFSNPLRDPNGEYTLDTAGNYHWVSVLTGEYSQNQTQSRYGVGGTDLGIMINKGEKTFFFFGDTFSEQDMTGNWRSNICAVTTDSDYTDGITFDY